MATYRSVGCQLAASLHYRRSVKKIVGLVIQNRNSDSILEKIAISILILKITTALDLTKLGFHHLTPVGKMLMSLCQLYDVSTSMTGLHL